MLMQKTKIGVITLVAILFGAIQILCACSAQTAQVEIPQDAMQKASVDTHRHHDISMPGNLVGQSETGHERDGHHCGHCSGDMVLASLLDGTSWLKILGSSNDAATLSSAGATPITRARLAPSSLDGLRWLDPPRSSLISQKILLLI